MIITKDENIVHLGTSLTDKCPIYSYKYDVKSRAVSEEQYIHVRNPIS
jgi:hypothetical protein